MKFQHFFEHELLLTGLWLALEFLVETAPTEKTRSGRLLNDRALLVEAALDLAAFDLARPGLLWFVVVVVVAADVRIGFVVSREIGEVGGAAAEGGNADGLGLDGALVPWAAEAVDGLLHAVGNWRWAKNKYHF